MVWKPPPLKTKVKYRYFYLDLPTVLECQEDMQIVSFIIKIAFVFLHDIQLMASVILQCVVTFHLLLRMNLHKFEFLYV